MEIEVENYPHEDDAIVDWKTPTPPSQTNFLDHLYHFLSSITQEHIWFVCIFIPIVYYLYVTFLRDAFNQYQLHRLEAQRKKNPDLEYTQVQAMQSQREEMQKRYQLSAERAKIKQEEREEQKRQERLEKIESLLTGHKLGGPPSNKTNQLKDDYNPLMGESSRGYRPEKRSCCGKKCG